MSGDDYRTMDYCTRCGESPDSGNHVLGKCAYTPPKRLGWDDELGRFVEGGRPLHSWELGSAGAFIEADAWRADRDARWGCMYLGIIGVAVGQCLGLPAQRQARHAIGVRSELLARDLMEFSDSLLVGDVEGMAEVFGHMLRRWRFSVRSGRSRR